jgi:putative endonuclease
VTTAKRAEGDEYETRALQFLQSNGLVLVKKNWQCRTGEIDLVMREGATLVFIEVRKRSSHSHGGALQSIAGAKSNRIRRAVDAYLALLPRVPDCRIDAVSFEQDDRPTWTRNVLS